MVTRSRLGLGLGTRDHLQLETAKHEQEHAGQAGEAQGDTHKQLEEQPLPRWVVELLGPCHRADAPHTLVEGRGHAQLGGRGAAPDPPPLPVL